MEPAAPTPVERSRAGRRRALLAGAASFLLLVAWSPQLATPAFTPRLTILLVVAAAGLPALVAEARSRHPAAVAALAFVAWAALSAVIAGTSLAWTGEYPLGTGAIFVTAVGGAWALARRLDADGRRGLVTGALSGALLNAALAVLQMGVDLGIRELELFHDRSTGLLGNPVFLGAISAAALPLVALRLRSQPALWAVAAGLLGAATQVSGSRIALALLLAGIGVLVASLRARPAMAVLAVLAVVGGVAAGGALTGVDADRARGAAERLASPTAGAAGVSQRIEIWQAGLAAAADRPVAGWGPGRFQDGASPHRSLRLARLTPNTFSDAHNLGIEHLATGGIVGLLALLAWLGLAGREAWARRRIPLLGSVVVLIVVHAVEPQNVATTPLFAALLGAAGAPEGGMATISRRFRTIGVALVVPALAAGAVLLAGDAWARVGLLDFDAEAAARASDALPMWAAPVALEARIAIFDHETTGDAAALRRAVALSAEAVDREPNDPAMLELRAALLGRAGSHDAAAAAWSRVLEVNPWSVQALTALEQRWEKSNDAAAAEACATLLDLLDSEVEAPADIEELRLACRTGAATRNGSGPEAAPATRG